MENKLGNNNRLIYQAKTTHPFKQNEFIIVNLTDLKTMSRATSVYVYRGTKNISMAFLFVCESVSFLLSSKI